MFKMSRFYKIDFRLGYHIIGYKIRDYLLLHNTSYYRNGTLCRYHFVLLQNYCASYRIANRGRRLNKIVGCRNRPVNWGFMIILRTQIVCGEWPCDLIFYGIISFTGHRFFVHIFSYCNQGSFLFYLQVLFQFYLQVLFYLQLIVDTTIS